ncbi:Aste57867_8646 [Aphanomyces stellatus]|uniref:Aste57867_8646 protein n=1 Tax=Aphanomyces stellatus TaxID=120398 RepID=A0A485KL62_9STRA|nr:hypothetical protein As57867_008612 [Aphanomyces stellatus]VFT85532.1 Aste57867_8646 [Aphanomyces stellatus]
MTFLNVTNKLRSSALVGSKNASNLFSGLPRFNVQVKATASALPPRKLNESLAFGATKTVKSIYTTGKALKNAFAH